MAYEVVKSENRYHGILLDVVVDTITLPKRSPNEPERTTRREIVRPRKPAAAILPIDSDGKMILVRQYRHSTGGFELELPAGILENGEDPAEGAARELEEEIGKKAGKLTKMFGFYSSIGVCDEYVTIFLAENLIDSVQNLDDDEFVTIEKYTPAEALELIELAGIEDSKTIAAISYYMLTAQKG
ncbi:MAG: NUDIX hydrolase [Clostridiales bacterium]|nr:NUDIX hydrolase [Clostridiales bacterium]